MGICGPITGTDQPDNCPVGSSYKAPTGYRKIPSTKCKGGVDLTGTVNKICKGNQKRRKI